MMLPFLFVYIFVFHYRLIREEVKETKIVSLIGAIIATSLLFFIGWLLGVLL